MRTVIALLLSILLTLVVAKPAYAEDSMSRGEWLSMLVDTFDITVDEEEYPDNYYTDVDNSSEYYIAIMRSVNFGIVDLEGGQDFLPNDPLTRGFAAQTLNYVIGYQLTEDQEYTYSDYEAVDESVRDSAQVAIDRKWFDLHDGKFDPDATVTRDEASAMLTDAEEVWHSSDLEGNEQDIAFKSGVKVVPDGTAVSFSDDLGTVIITKCPISLNSGDIFAVYTDGIPVALRATAITIDDEVTTVTVDEVAVDEAFESYEYQREGTINLTDAASPDSVAGEETLVAMAGGKTLKFNVNTGLVGFSGSISDVGYSYGYKDGAYVVKMSGCLNYTTSVSASTSAKIPILGVADKMWSLGLIGTCKVSGKIQKTDVNRFEVGVQYVGGSFRVIKSFTAERSSISANANGRVGVELVAECKVPHVVEAKLGVGTGGEANYDIDEWGDGKAPYICKNAEAHLYAEVYANATFGGDILSLSYGQTWPIWDANNSPRRIVVHEEDGVLVPSCTRGKHYVYGGKFGTLDFGGDGSSQGWHYGEGGAWEPYAIYEYTLDDDNQATITRYYGNMRTLIIPDTLDGYTVVGIGCYGDMFGLGYGAFAGNAYLTSVQIPETVTKIDQRVFSKCSSLTQVSLPSGLASLGAYAFENCSNLYSIAIPASLTECTNDYPYNNYGPFSGCDGLKEIIWPTGYKEVPDRLFAGCTGIEEIALPEGITKIGAHAFKGCTSLAKVTLPSTLTSVGNYAFSGCKALASVDVPDAVTYIGEHCFENCESLEGVHLPKALLTIGDCAFMDCDLLASVEIPAALRECTNGYPYNNNQGAFYHCDGLKEIVFADGTKQIAPRVLAGTTGVEELVIPEGVTSIAEYAMRDCTSLAKVTLPSTLTSVGNYAFSGCKALASVDVPDAVTYIGEHCFENCESLESANLPEGLTAIGSYAFKGTGLTKVVIPDSVTGFGTYMFTDCIKLTEAKLTNSINNIPSNTFKGCLALESVSLPSSLNAIKENAFSGCVSLKAIDIPATVSTIGSSAFYNCDALSKVVIPSSVTSLGTKAFYDCDILTDLTIGTGISAFPSEAFRHCDILETVIIPYRVSTIGSNAFSECVKLVYVFIPQSTTEIDSSAFSYSDRLVIYGVADSYAQTYAEEKDIRFEAVEIEPESIVLDASEITILKGQSAQIAAEIKPANFTGAVTWKSSDTSIATVDSYGTIMGVEAGTTTVKLVVGNNAASVRVNVVQGVTRISLNKSSVSIEGGQTLQLTATVYPSNANDKTIEWSSSDVNVVAVDESGLITALTKGTATITCAAKDGSGRSATCRVTVTNDAYVVNDVALLESPHPYAANCTDVWVYRLDNADGLSVTFDERTSVEEGSDYIVVYDSSDNVVGTYTGTQLAGTTIEVPGDTLKIRLKSDEALSEWGFKVAAVQAAAYVKDISLDKSSLSLVEGDTAQLVATVSADGGADTTVRWSSSDNSVATVSADGVVTANTQGVATITATAGEKTASCEVTVSTRVIPVTGVTIDRESVTITSLEETVQLTATVTPDNATDRAVEWRSSDESVATVSQSGQVTPVSEGSVDIIAMAGSGRFSATCHITVDLPETIVPVTGVKLDKESVILTALGETAWLTATVEPVSATDNSVSWTSSDESVVSVSANGQVTAVGSGTATVTVSTTDGGYRATCEVDVKLPEEEISVTGVSLDKTELSLTTKGEQAILSAVVEPTDASNKGVRWSCSDESVATVSADGMVTAVADGTATVTVTTDDGSFSASCSVVVSIEVPVKSIDAAMVAAIPDQMYTGKEIKPSITVSLDGITLVEGEDFEVSYSANVEVGTATVSITGIGGYAGTKTTTFLIVAPDEPSVPTFVDVSGSTAHNEDIVWLANAGISAGWTMSDGTVEFRPYANVARADMAAFLFRLAKGWGLVDESWQPSGRASFRDVSAKTAHYREVMWLAEVGISEGWTVGGGKEFRPYANVARADMAAFLFRLARLAGMADDSWQPSGASPFTDVTARTAHYREVMWLAEMKVSAGWTMKDGTRQFRPYANVARADMAAFLHRLEGLR